MLVGLRVCAEDQFMPLWKNPKAGRTRFYRTTLSFSLPLTSVSESCLLLAVRIEWKGLHLWCVWEPTRVSLGEKRRKKRGGRICTVREKIPSARRRKSLRGQGAGRSRLGNPRLNEPSKKLVRQDVFCSWKKKIKVFGHFCPKWSSSIFWIRNLRQVNKSNIFLILIPFFDWQFWDFRFVFNFWVFLWLRKISLIN